MQKCKTGANFAQLALKSGHENIAGSTNCQIRHIVFAPMSICPKVEVYNFSRDT